MRPCKWRSADAKPAEGLTHHSDRGVQYASNDYTGLLKEHGVRISMSRRGNPYDNAACESFMKTLKYEEVYRQEYRDLADARACIDRFMEKIYNGKRLHSALGYLSPAEFETLAAALDRNRRPHDTQQSHQMRFSGMAESIGPMWFNRNPGRMPPPVGRRRCPGIGHAGRNTPCPSSAMSSGRLFLDGLLASIARLRFTDIIRLTLLPLRRKSFTIER